MRPALHRASWGLASRLLPLALAAGTTLRSWQLGILRARMWGAPPGRVLRGGRHRVRVTDGPNFYMQYKDEFIHRIYHFEASRPDPLIIDGGSNVGMSILYFKRLYPGARIVGFEPDPAIFAILEENLHRNGVRGVRLVKAGLGGAAGRFAFAADASSGGQVLPDPAEEGVAVDCLSNYLREPVDFLKLNIEGLELDVLREAADRNALRRVREMVIEYHGWPGQPQRLGPLLDLLDRCGYRYLVHDFDRETCPATKPPFRLTPRTKWFCLVYAKRADLVAAPRERIEARAQGSP